jgi:outer membrane protein assembly factor BamB
MISSRVLGIVATSAVAACVALGSQPVKSQFEDLGIPVRKGGLTGCIVGPDGRGGEALYFSFNQSGAPLFLVQVNPDTGRSRQFHAPSGVGAHALAIGPDEKVYLGTWDGAVILRLDPKQPDKGVEILGRPSATESYIWMFAAGKDRRLYGCTFPQAKLVGYDPATNRMEDLGRMSETEMYARSLAAGADGKIYVGIGMVKPDVVAYDPATRRHRSILPSRYQGFSGAPWVWGGEDGHVYAGCSGKTLRVDCETVTETDKPIGPPPRKLRDGRIVTTVDRGAFSIHDPKSGKTAERRFHYEAAGDPLFTVGVGPHGCIYGSTAMPLEVFRYDPRAGKSEDLGPMGGGEVYSMIEHEGKLYLCFYGGSVMNLYDPAKPFWKWGSSAGCNPISFGGVGDGHLRPRAMIDGPDGMIYIGSHPPYGELGGAMAVWDPRQNRTIENYRHLVKNQSIVSLAYEPQSGLVFGGSGNFGGGGTQASEKEALFFAFDPRKKQKVFETALVPGVSHYEAMCAAEGKVFVAVANRLVVFDPASMKPVRTAALPGSQIEISLGRHPSGLLYGLTARAVYSVDPKTLEVRVFAKPPVAIGCGFAITADAVYFGSGVHLWRCRLRAAGDVLVPSKLGNEALERRGPSRRT